MTLSKQETARRGLAGPLLALAVLGLGACASTSSGSPSALVNNRVGSTEVKPVHALTGQAADVKLPDPAQSSWISEGTFVNTENLRRMERGLSKPQVMNLLGTPHFEEGFFGVREWNYVFNFRTGQGNEYISCQYRVDYNNDLLTQEMYWQNPECAAAAKPVMPKPLMVAPMPAPAPVAPAPVPAPAKVAQRMTLSADALFQFDGATRQDMLPNGPQEIQRLAAQIKSDLKPLHYILVTGHTDRLGSDAYNEALSLARAQTVRDLLIGTGIDGKLIRAMGMGERQPVVVNCQGEKASPALVECLKPNRRVELEVSGQQ